MIFFFFFRYSEFIALTPPGKISNIIFLGFNQIVYLKRIFIIKDKLIYPIESNINFDSKSGHMTERVETPIGQQDQYLKFSPSAVDELFSHTIKHDTPLVYRINKKRPSNPVNFVVKEELNGIAVSVQWSDINTTLDLFKNKPFYYLFRSEYIPQSVKDIMREMNEGITSEKTPTNPTAGSNNNFTPNNSKDYSAYK